ncbi:SDR family oxidoreductase [Quadrisphaera sp. KR29]|uniref:SDR family oxidoreductase n=1 Tax=Quadrisphaera sp. KR29 TaxID=3461391 RepID=UPI004044E701
MGHARQLGGRGRGVGSTLLRVSTPGPAGAAPDGSPVPAVPAAQPAGRALRAGSGAALVVGASSAIGAAIAQGLAARGHHVHLWGRDPDRLARAAHEVAAGAAAGAAVSSDVVDVRDRRAVAEAAQRCPEPLRVLVYAAGVFDWADAVDADADRWEEVLDVTGVPAAQTTRTLLPHLLRGAPSTAVLIGSGAAVTAYPHNAAYVAAKHLLAGLAGSLGAELRGRGVRVSLVNPGMVAAGASLDSPVGRRSPGSLLQAQDVADVVLQVVSAPARVWVSRVDLQPTADPSA